MNLAKQIAKQQREVLLDGKWIALTNLKKQISDLNWQQATTSIEGLNSIALLTFHLNYYVAGLIKVLEGGPLDISDKFSFDMPPIASEEAWLKLKDDVFSNAERFVELISQMAEAQIFGPFVDEKYGSYYRNLTGMTEHCYYHLGQIVLLKKLVLAKEA